MSSQPAQGTSYKQTLVEFAILLVLAAFGAVVFLSMVGCSETKAHFNQHKKITDPDTGLVVYEKRTGTDSFARAPENAAGPTTQAVTEQGVFASIAGVHTETAEQIIAQNQVVFYWAAAGFGLAAILGATLLKSKPLAIGFGVAAAASAGTPTFLHEVGPWLLPAGGGSLLIGLIWYLAKRHASNESSKLAGQRFAEAEKLMQQQKYVDALDLMRSGIDAMAVNKPVLKKALHQ